MSQQKPSIANVHQVFYGEAEKKGDCVSRVSINPRCIISPTHCGSSGYRKPDPGNLSLALEVHVIKCVLKAHNHLEPQFLHLAGVDVKSASWVTALEIVFQTS